MAHLVGLETQYLNQEGAPLEVFEVNWVLGNKCNHSCSYCPSYKHDGSIPGVLDATAQDRVFRLLDTIEKNSKVDLFKFNFSGGEPTIVPGFNDFCKKLKTQYSSLIHINTNGSRPLHYWQENWDCFDTISMSFHTEFVHHEKFLQNYQFLSERVFTIIAVMMHPHHWNECLQFIEKVKRLDRYSYGQNMIFLDWPAPEMKRHPDYTAEQIEFLQTNQGEVHHRPLETRPNIQQKFITYWSDGSQREDLGKQDIINKSLNHFTDWKCWISTKHMSIVESGDLFTAGCHYQQKIGNLYQGEIKPFTKPLICGAKVCHCHPYLATKKQHPSATLFND